MITQFTRSAGSAGGTPGACEVDAEGAFVNSQYAPAFTALEFAADVADSGWAPSWIELEFAANPVDSQFAPAMTELEFTADPKNSQWSPAFTQLEFVEDFPDSQYASAFTALEFAANPVDSQFAPAYTKLEFDGTMKNSQWDIGQYEVEVTGMEVRADCWYANIAGCVGGGNNNADPLNVEGIAASRKDLWVRFPVNSFPTGTTVNNGRFIFRLHAAGPVAEVSSTVRDIANAGENWVETNPSCNAPLVPDGPEVADLFVVPAGSAAGTEITTEFNSDGFTELGNDMGNRSFTIGLLGTVLAENVQLHDRTDALPGNRPRMIFNFTKVV